MNQTTVTALIITFHHASVVLSLAFALILSILFFGIFLRSRGNRWLLFLLIFFFFVMLGGLVSEKIFLTKPIKLEMVTAG